MNLRNQVSILFLLFFGFSNTAFSIPCLDIINPPSDSLSLYIFLLDDCPICLDYTLTINALHSEYGEEIDFIGYFPNFSSKPEKIDHFRETYNIAFPLYSDYYKKQAKKWNAEVTPEVILYNHTRDQIIYQGRIDNKFVRLGKRRNVVTQHDLKDAIEYSIKGQKVSNTYQAPVGCYINYMDLQAKQK